MNTPTDRATPDLLVMKKYEQFAAVVAERAEATESQLAELRECLRAASIIATHAAATEEDEIRAALVKVLCELLEPA